MLDELYSENQPCFCLSDPADCSLVYASPAALALAGGTAPEYSWQLFGSGDAWAELYKGAPLSSTGNAPLPLPDRGLLFSSLTVADGRKLRLDVLIRLGLSPDQSLAAAAALIERYTRALELTNPPHPQDPDEVWIRLFGSLGIETTLGRLTGAEITSRKCCLLLLYLLCNRDRVIPVRELAEALWPDQILDDPYNMLKNVAFRLRRSLAPICERPLVVAHHGTYLLNPELRFEVDCDSFDKLMRLYYRHPGVDPECLAAAIKLYRGSLMPALDTELWLIARTHFYKNAYLQAVQDYADLMLEKNDYISVYVLTRDAMSVYPYEPALHMILFRALARDKGPAEARRYLQQVYATLPSDERQMLESRKEQLEKECGITAAG